MASSYQQKFPVPDGFPEILHDLMKAVLREQPSDIVEYSYQYFENMSKGLGNFVFERALVLKEKANIRQSLSLNQNEYRPRNIAKL